jgi:hypothetical protein
MRKKILKGLRSNKKSIIIVKAERILFWLWWFLLHLYYKIAHYKGLRTNNNSLCINFYQEFNKLE